MAEAFEERTDEQSAGGKAGKRAHPCGRVPGRSCRPRDRRGRQWFGVVHDTTGGRRAGARATVAEHAKVRARAIVGSCAVVANRDHETRGARREGLLTTQRSADRAAGELPSSPSTTTPSWFPIRAIRVPASTPTATPSPPPIDGLGFSGMASAPLTTVRRRCTRARPKEETCSHSQCSRRRWACQLDLRPLTRSGPRSNRPPAIHRLVAGPRSIPYACRACPRDGHTMRKASGPLSIRSLPSRAASGRGRPAS